MICHLMVGLPNLWASYGRIRDDHETNFVSTGETGVWQMIFLADLAFVEVPSVKFLS